jgi:hypothetical protein
MLVFAGAVVNDSANEPLTLRGTARTQRTSYSRLVALVTAPLDGAQGARLAIPRSRDRLRNGLGARSIARLLDSLLL